MSNKWIKNVTSDAMYIPIGLFTKNAKEIAKGLKYAVEHSNRTHGSKFASAMSMLNYYINRGGKKLHPERIKILNQAKIELRKLFKKI